MLKINLVGAIQGNTGYNVHTRNTLLALDKLCDVALETRPFKDWETSPYARFIEKQYGEEITILITTADWWRIKFPEDLPFLIGFLVWEGDKLPLNWARNCKDDRLDMIFTPSEHTKTAAINSGVDKDKIKVIPHGVDCSVFKSKGTKLWDDRIFRFLFVGGWKDGVLDRKGLDIGLRAFKEEFKDQDDVEFVAKINMAYGGNVKVNLEGLNLSSDLPKINVIIDDLNEEQLAELYRSSDVFVMPTKAEAFCLPIFESLACGTSFIATDYGGHTEYCRKFGLLIRGEWIQATGGILYEGVKWKQINYKLLKQAMRRAFVERDMFERMGQKGAKYIKRNLTWEKTAKRIIKEIENRKL